AIATLKGRNHPVAAFLVDGIFSSDGVFPDPAGFLSKSVDAVRAAGGLLIADEVQPGFGRTGQMWGFERHGLDPDIITMGKPMANGYPVSGMATRPDILSRFCEDVGYFNTFGSTPVSAAAGLAVLDVIEDENLIDNAKAMGTYLLDQLQDLGKTESRVGAVRGAGLFLGIDLVDEQSGAPCPDLAKGVINSLRHHHVLIGAAGKFGHTLKVRPPLCLSREDADFFIDALASALSQTKEPLEAVASPLV
ncbi:MAG: aminotransferase class III-fold pyridoxal phosphate-dependent enzyme, partial [Pseudomonadota bacterium]